MKSGTSLYILQLINREGGYYEPFPVYIFGDFYYINTSLEKSE